MDRVIKNHILEHLFLPFETEDEVNPKRVYELNNKPVKNGDVVYLVTREFRFFDNFALNYAKEQAQKLNRPLKIIFKVDKFENKGKQKFFDSQFERVQKEFEKSGITFKITREFDPTKGVGLLVKDFDVLDAYHADTDFKVVEVDGKNILPAKFVSDKQEFNAASFRRKVYFNISEFLTEFPRGDVTKRLDLEPLRDFISQKLPDYAEYKNNPVKEVTSGFSKYLNFGFISPQRIAIEVIKSDVSAENKEEFLEELIVRKELSDNFCLFCKDYKSLKCIPDWAKETLKSHEKDIRTNLFTKDELENAQTYDDLWNASQKQLVKEGKIAGYLRMYWAKQILQWSPDAETALDIAVYLNDKYGYDAPSANGYVGILWSIGALHDRPFADRHVSGKVRSMTYNGAKHKFDVEKYIKRYL